MSELPKGWTRVSLGEIVQPRKEKANPQKLGDLPFIGLEHVEAHSSRLLGTSRASDVKSAVVLFKAGDVLYGRLRPYLNKVIQPDFAGCASAEFIVFPGSTAIDLAFLRRVLSQPRFVGFASHINQGDRPRVDFEQISTFEFGLPPLAEQRRIVAKLDSLFARTHRAREELARIPTLIKHYKEAILAAAFRGELTVDWREKHFDTDTWKKLPLGNVVQELRYGTSKKCSYNPSLTPVLRIPNIGDGTIIQDDLKHATFDQREINSLSLRRGDILIIRSNGSLDLVGKAAVVTEREEEFLYAGYLIRLRPRTTFILPEFLYFHLCEPITRTCIEERAKSTSGVNNINSEEIRSLGLQIPSLQEQEAIVNRIKNCFAAIGFIQEETQKTLDLLSHLQQAILSKAFRGELVPQDPNDEPASVLLDRIRAARSQMTNAPRARRRSQQA